MLKITAFDHFKISHQIICGVFFICLSQKRITNIPIAPQRSKSKRFDYLVGGLLAFAAPDLCIAT
jgi:hypothetical protein